jgi:hypothetical protein
MYSYYLWKEIKRHTCGVTSVFTKRFMKNLHFILKIIWGTTTWAQISGVRHISPWKIRTLNCTKCRSQWPWGLRRGSAADCCSDCVFESRRSHWRLSLLSVVYYHVEVSATVQSPVQNSPTYWGCVTVCDLETSRIKRLCLALGCCAIKENCTKKFWEKIEWYRIWKEKCWVSGHD